jgi:hypothetical protein
MTDERERLEVRLHEGKPKTDPGDDDDAGDGDDDVFSQGGSIARAAPRVVGCRLIAASPRGQSL